MDDLEKKSLYISVLSDIGQFRYFPYKNKDLSMYTSVIDDIRVIYCDERLHSDYIDPIKKIFPFYMRISKKDALRIVEVLNKFINDEME
jgi:hypothetical protein